MTREYHELVRDGIPAIVEAGGEEPVVHVADEEFEERIVLERVEE